MYGKLYGKIDGKKIKIDGTIGGKKVGKQVVISIEKQMDIVVVNRQ